MGANSEVPSRPGLPESHWLKAHVATMEISDPKVDGPQEMAPQVILHVHGELYHWQIAFIYVTTFNFYNNLVKAGKKAYLIWSCQL